MSALLLFRAQRYSAMVLAPLVIIHIIVMIIAVRNGLSAEEILSRTQGSFLWGVFYTLFVVAAAIHAPIGVRNVLIEWLSVKPLVATIAAKVLFVILLWLGLRAVMAVVF